MRLLVQHHVNCVPLMLSAFSLLLLMPVISISGETLETNLPPPSPPVAEHPLLHALSWIPKPSVVYENQPTTIEFKVRNDENFTVYDVQVTGFTHTGTAKLELQDLSSIKSMEPHAISSITGTISALSLTKTENIDLYWTITAKNETGTIMESTMFQRPITVEADQLETSTLSLYLSDYWISRGEVLSVKGSLYDLKMDAELAEFEIKIAGPLPENNPIFSENITVKNGGNFSLLIKISDAMEPGKYNITMFATNHTLTKLYSLTSFIVRGPAFVPMDIKYIGPNSTAKLQYIYTDTDSVMFMDTNSSRYGWYASAETKTIQITVVGKEGTQGYMNLVIPKEVVRGVEEVKIVPRADSEYSIDTNSTHTMITMNYPHNEEETLIIIKSAFMVPEFPFVWLVLIASFFVVSMYTRRFWGKYARI